jgi:hypothetical protein
MNQLRRRIQTAMQTRGGAAAWTPASIAGLKVWLDASQITGLNDGDAVATWSDLSGLANDVTQATASQKPTYKTAILNGRAVVRFDGVDDFMETAVNFGTNNSLAGDIVASVFVVYRKLNVNAGHAYGWGTGATMPLKSVGVYDDNSIQQYAFAGNNGLNFNSCASSTWFVREFHKSAGAINTTGETLLNGTSDLRSGSSANTPNVRGSDSFKVGRWTDTSYHLEGDVAELLVYQGTAASSNRAGIRAYLNAKWAVY